MSLAGRLDSFPLPEVLGLLARSKKTGCLNVKADGVDGRIYLLKGTLTYGTTRRKDDLGDRIVSAGLVTETNWLEVERLEKPISDVLLEDKSEADLQAFIQELVTDAVFRLARDQDGEFDFEEDVGPPYETGQKIAIKDVLAETAVRVDQWRDVESVIPGVSFGLRMAPQTNATQDIVVSPDAWRTLAALEGVGSIAEVADRLGSNDFQVGRILAELVEVGLVVIVDEDLTNSSFYYYGDEEDTEESESDSEETETAEDKTEPALFRGRKGLGSVRPSQD